MSSELLDQDLHNYVKARGEGLLILELKSVIRQVAMALQHLRSFKIVHADIRPENIMIVDRRQQPIRSSRLGIHPPTEAIDIWSTGATPVEVATASTILLKEEEYDELSQIIQCHGQPSDEILDRGKDTASYFCEQVDGEHRWRFKTPSEYEEETGLQAQTFTSIRLDDVPVIMAHGDPEDKNLFADLLKRMMQLDQDEGITLLEVLQHPFLNESSPQGPLENNAVSLPGPDEHWRDVSLESSSRQPGAQEGDACVIEIPSDLAIDVQLETSSTQSGYGDCEGNMNSISVCLDVESEGSTDNNQPDLRSEKCGLFGRLVRLLRNIFHCFF
ncbi:Homeodomain-interacting protein kinase 3 [Takifugu flavidus]|uniref:Homeodomain-interacting protein kinase 3 n=1 Tax=Takifugu flavidus TaxID=433684 RepID=A0A5C6N6Y9_9TELE|nr:Homeodomain-interacting protein kinase 3 [Takifugu flavidus]